MNLDELRTVQSKERRKDSLQQLRDSFYRDVATFIQDLKANRDRRAEQVADPFSDNEVRRLSDELETAEEVAEAVYERRVGKVVKLASFAAADMPVDDEGMTSEERELFEDLVARISQNKQDVLDVLSGTAESADRDSSDQRPAGPTNPVAAPNQQEPASRTEPSASQSDQPTESTASEPDSVLAEAMGPDSSEPQPETVTESVSETGPQNNDTEPVPPTEVPPPEAEPEPDAVLGTSTDGGTTEVADPSQNGAAHGEPAGPAVEETSEPETPTPETADNANSTDRPDNEDDRTTVRITKNVGDIFCVDGREYTLRSEDVVTLPTANAEPLVDREAAHRLE